jgi:acid stress-induced BolA-like protein IbaG/YrbA
MSHHPTRLSEADTLAQLRQRIADAIPGAEIAVRGSGGHFEIDVVSEAFEGLNTLKKQRLVYSAIKELMAGDDAPVHAVDRMRLTTPGA